MIGKWRDIIMRVCNGNRVILVVLLLAILSSFSINTPAQENNTFDGKINTDLDAGKRQKIVEAVIKTMRDYYIWPEKAEEMAALLEKNLKEGAYDNFDQRDPFIRRLTQDLRSVAHDLHLGVWPLETSLTLSEISEEAKIREAAWLRYTHYGMPKVKRLHGNIGYLEILDFDEPPEAEAATIAAMNFLAGSDALVIDLRRCGGGSGYTGRIIDSYFFDEPTHIGNVYTRYTDENRQSWTMPYVPGPKLIDVPIYILQSRRTASAAESMGYALQTQKRATIVGEKSRGAANPVDEINFPELSICGDVTSRVTGSGWEGGGVTPDIDVPAERALMAACLDAMEKLTLKEADDDIKRVRQWALDQYKAEMNPVKIDEKELKQLCGDYSSSVSVWVDEGYLHMRRANGEPAVTLIPLGKDEFGVKEREARVRFNRDGDGKVTEMMFIFADGYDYTFKKNEV